MRTKTKQWLILAGILGITLMLSGCFFSEQTLVIGADGKADVKVEFWFDKIQAGDQGAIGMQELLYLFPELQDYEMTRTEKRIEYSTYLVYSFRAQGVDINKNQYIDFVKKDDGSYSLTIRIPKAIEEKKEKNDKVLIVRVTMPAEIDIANTMNFSGDTAEWELRTNDFTRDITLKTFTKTSEQQIQSLKYDDPAEVAVGFVNAVENDNLKIAYEYWQDKELAKESSQALVEREEEWGKWGPVMTVHHIQKISPEEYLVSVPYWDEEFHEGRAFARYQVKRFDSRWLITCQELQSIHFSAPEDTVENFYWAALIKQSSQLAFECWSDKTDPRLAQQFSSPLVMEIMLNNFEDLREQFFTLEIKTEEDISDKVCWVTADFKGLGEGRPDRLKLVKENNEWKILMFDGPYDQEEKWLQQQIDPVPGFSTPEDTVRSFYAAFANGEIATAKACWSYKTPYYLVDSLTEILSERVEKDCDRLEVPRSLLAAIFSLEECEKEQIDENSYYVWMMNPDEKGVRERREGNQYRVIKENGDWKILASKGMESAEKMKFLLQALESKEGRKVEK